MKRFISLAIIASLCLAACGTIHVNPFPAGAKACGSDWDCPDGQGCGFPNEPGFSYARCLPGLDHRWDYQKSEGE